MGTHCSVCGLTNGGLVRLNLSQQVSLTQLLTHLLLPALNRAHGHGGGQSRQRDLEKDIKMASAVSTGSDHEVQ